MWAMTSAVALPSPARARTQNGRWKPAWLTLHLQLNYFIATTVWSPTVSSSSLQPIEAEIHVPCVSATRLWNNLTIKFSLFQSYSIDRSGGSDQPNWFFLDICIWSTSFPAGSSWRRLALPGDRRRRLGADLYSSLLQCRPGSWHFWRVCCCSRKRLMILSVCRFKNYGEKLYDRRRLCV